MAKADYLKDCMTDIGTIPIDQFNLIYCRKCGNSDCARSVLSTSAFENRVANWKDVLFDKVPRVNDNDERYDNVRIKWFKHQSSEPRMEPIPIIKEPEFKPEPEPEPELYVKEEPNRIVPELQIEIKEIEPVIAKPELVQVTPDNTPFEQGMKIGEEPKETVLGSDGVYTFGGDDE